MKADVGESSPRNGAQRWWRVRIPYFLLALLMVFFAYKFVEKDREIHRLQAQASALRASNYQTSQMNDHMQRSLPYYRSQAYVAAEAHALLSYTFPGDTLVQSDPSYQPVVQVRRAPLRPLAPPKPTWQQWWDAFFG